ncbi:hypothetical protein OG806_07380 [Streptomyces sp. NBC_00882]|uniref:hypothetical protein n=1 Tax=Streptomyces sp. NBC_00882 TaxID=2975856 RepID=UPI00386737FC|nr:hypothetical protein OG806_07380 [Streptomyces sp. NBC_00882]
MALLVVGRLMTRAVRHAARTPRGMVTGCPDAGQLVVAVGDQDPRPVGPAGPSACEGLRAVEELAAFFNGSAAVEPVTDSRGKTAVAASGFLGRGEEYVQGVRRMRFEITFLHADGDHAAHTADVAEVGALVAWAGQTGVRVRIRPSLMVSGRDAGCGMYEEPGNGPFRAEAGGMDTVSRSGTSFFGVGLYAGWPSFRLRQAQK